MKKKKEIAPKARPSLDPLKKAYEYTVGRCVPQTLVWAYSFERRAKSQECILSADASRFGAFIGSPLADNRPYNDAWASQDHGQWKYIAKHHPTSTSVPPARFLYLSLQACVLTSAIEFRQLDFDPFGCWSEVHQHG